MIDRHFTLALLAVTLFGGTFAIGHELLQPRSAATSAQAQIATLPRVVVTGQKQPAATALAQIGGAVNASLVR